MRKIFLMLALVTLFVLGCGSGKHPAEAEFDKIMSSLKKGDFKSLAGNNGKEKDFKSLEILVPGYEKMTYKVNKTTEKDGGAVINVTIKYPYLKGVMEESIKEMMGLSEKMQGKSDKELEEESTKIFGNKIKEKLGKSDLKYNEETLDVTMTKKDGKWDIDPDKNPQFTKAVLLGAFE